jgi:serine carboxypeptidase-like clade 1
VLSKRKTQGYAIGNAVTDKRFDGNALVPFAAGHSLISADLHAAVAAACNGEYWNATKGEPASARCHSH